MPRSTAALLLLACAAASPAAVFDVRAFGADATGAAPSTRAIRAALAAMRAAGGGTLYFPPGIYHSAPFNLTSNSVLLLDDATLFAVKMESGAFKVIPPLPSYGEGRDKLPNDLAGRFEPFIGVYYASDVEITTNSSGVIDGAGFQWWAAKDAGTLQNTPPHLIEVGWSSRVTVGAPAGAPLDALTLESSPFWNVRPDWARAARAAAPRPLQPKTRNLHRNRCICTIATTPGCTTCLFSRTLTLCVPDPRSRRRAHTGPARNT